MKTIPNDTFFACVEAELAEGRPVRFRLKGNSMYPLLRNGKDVVVLGKCPPNPYSRWMWYCSATGESMYFITSSVVKENGC